MEEKRQALITFGATLIFTPLEFLPLGGDEGKLPVSEQSPEFSSEKDEHSPFSAAQKPCLSL